MRFLSRLVVLVAFLLPASGTANARDVDIIDQWRGVIRDDAVKAALPTPLAVRDKFAWDDLWKATHPEDPEGISPPAVDFETDMVLIAIVPGPNQVAPVAKLTLDEKGNVNVTAAGTKIGGPGFGFAFIRVARDGIKAVNGKALTTSLTIKKQIAGIRPDAALNLAGTFVIPITEEADFASQWRSTAGNDGKAQKWDVNFAREIVIMVRSAANSVKAEEVTLDSSGDMNVISQTTPLPQQAAAPPIGFGYVLLLIDREGIVTVQGKPITPATQTKPATAPAAGRGP